MRLHPCQMTEAQIAQGRYYAKGAVIRVVGKLTLEKSQYKTRDGQIRFGLRCWRGRGLKSFIYNGYRTLEKRDADYERLINSERNSLVEKETRRANDKAARAALEDPFPVGTVFYNSWGYDQTNVDWYEVSAVKGLRLTLRRIGCKASGYDSGECQPERGAYLESYQPVTKMVQISNGQPYVAAEFGAMSVWEGKPQYWSSYH